MSQLMENLFSLMTPPHAAEEERRAVREAREAVQAVKDRLTLEEFDAFWQAATGVEDAGCLDCFTLGFRLGVQLTIEGLRPIVE